jgi:hypothetical protein
MLKAVVARNGVNILPFIKHPLGTTQAISIINRIFVRRV